MKFYQNVVNKKFKMAQAHCLVFMFSRYLPAKSVRMGENCARALENGPSLPGATSQPVNNIHIFVPVSIWKVKKSGRGLGVV